jgi:sugar lactone lactonase YvrE
MAEVRCILDAKTTLGECPVWSAEERALYWVDIMAPALNRLDPDGSQTGDVANRRVIEKIGARR